MTACIHGEVCREYLRQRRGIICRTCPRGCRFYEPKRERTCHNISTVPCKFTCSECHQSWRKANGNGAFAYCPNCGAKVIQE